MSTKFVILAGADQNYMKNDEIKSEIWLGEKYGWSNPDIPSIETKTTIKDSFLDHHLKLRKLMDEENLFEMPMFCALSTWLIDISLYFLFLTMGCGYTFGLQLTGWSLTVWCFFSGFLQAFPLIRIGYHQHDYLHGQYGTKRGYMKYWHQFNCFLKASGDVWWNKHEHGPHHKHANDFKYDPDNFTAWLSRWWVWPILILFLHPMMTLASLRFGNFQDRVLVGAHVMIFYGYFMPWSAIIGRSVGWFFSMFMPLILHHTAIVYEHPSKSYFALQVLNSQNIKHNWWVTWWMGGNDYQIEHHVFPSMPRWNLDRASIIIKDYIEKNTDLTYHEYGVREAYKEFFAVVAEKRNNLKKRI